MFIRGFYVLLVLLYTCREVRSQESIFEEINTILSNSKDSVNNAEKINLNLDVTLDTAINKNLKDSLSALNVRKLNLQEIQEADTNLFEERLVEVKKPLSDKKLQTETDW